MGPPGDRVEFLDLAFDRLTLGETIDWVEASLTEARFAFVVTPNVDHMIRMPRLDGALKIAYRSADLCLCDSRVLHRLARLCDVDLPVVPGSDLTARLLDRLQGTEVMLVGADEEALARLCARFPALAFAQHIPPMGLLRNPVARADTIEMVVAAQPQLILLAVGSPQQELLAYEMKRDGRATGTALCIGASVDFLVGRERRAPRIVQRAGLEWAWRLSRNPKRLARRYLIDDPAIFAMTWSWSRKRKRRD